MPLPSFLIQSSKAVTPSFKIHPFKIWLSLTMLTVLPALPRSPTICLAIEIEVIGHSALTRMDQTTAQHLSINFLPRCGFNKQRTSQENMALVLHNDVLVCHSRDIPTTYPTLMWQSIVKIRLQTCHHWDTMYNRNLRNSEGGHLILSISISSNLSRPMHKLYHVIKNTAKVFLVWEHIHFMGESSTSGFHCSYDRTRAETSWSVWGQGRCHLDLDASFWDGQVSLLGAPQLHSMTLEVLVGSWYLIWHPANTIGIIISDWYPIPLIRHIRKGSRVSEAGIQCCWEQLCIFIPVQRTPEARDVSKIWVLSIDSKWRRVVWWLEQCQMVLAVTLDNISPVQTLNHREIDNELSKRCAPWAGITK